MTKLSQYDEKLSNAAKQGIKSAKQNYAKAQAKGDEAGMAQANAYANSIRRQYGGYTGGDDGSGYYPVVVEQPSFRSQYDDQISKAQKRIINTRDFSYNPESDPVYQLYKKVYTQMGNDAYDRAMAQSSIKTGGIVNTNAAASAVQAQNYYSSALADKAAELYKDAYGRYIDSINREYDILDMLEQADKNDYSRYLDEVDAFKDIRDFEYGIYNDEITSALNKIAQNSEAEYQAQRDSEEDRRWQEEFDYQRQQDNDSLAYDFAKLESDIAKWNEQVEIDKYNALAKLVQSVYNKSNIGVNLNALMSMLGM